MLKFPLSGFSMTEILRYFEKTCVNVWMGRLCCLFRRARSTHNFHACIARCCESRAASFNTSDRVGWAWKVKAISSALPP